jgi:hypothetical protein
MATTIYAAVVAVLYGGIYWLNQRAIATELKPRLEEIEAMLGAVLEEPERDGAEPQLP